MNLFTLHVGHQYPHGTHSSIAVENAIVETMLASGVDGFTLQMAAGYWKGEREITTVVTIMQDGEQEDAIVEAAQVIAGKLAQECVMVSRHGTKVSFEYP